MTWADGSLGLDLVWVAFWAGILLFLYLFVFRVLDLLPLGDDRRSALERVRPLVGLGGALVFSLFSAQTLFSHYPSVLPVALLLVLVGFFIGSRSLLSDLFAGIALKAEQSCEIGDHLRVGETRGRITALGPRAIVLETPEGDKVLIPYSHATRQPIVRTRSVERGSSRTFTLCVEDTLPMKDLSHIVERAALQQHWGSVTRPPELTVNPDSSVGITVFALAEEHTAELEAAVRTAIEKARPT